MIKYGWIPDKPDDRDFRYRSPIRLVPLPPKVDLRPFSSPVEDQGSLGSCTGQAFAAALEYIDRRVDGKYTDVSRLFIYYNERKLEDTINEDAGAYIRDGIKSLVKWGACDESLWPYDPWKFTDEPSVEAYRDGLKRRVEAYYRITSIQDLKSALADGLPIVFGIMVYESLETAEVYKTGIVPVPDTKKEKKLGGHCVKMAGYDDFCKWFIVKNSWGTTFGDKGYMYIPYEFIENPALASDFWAIVRMKEIEMNEEPVNPMPTDIVWYVPIIGIIKGIISVWKRIFGKQEK